ncbi:MAG: hypothetical protein ACKVWV_03505 [Planctomycetota bacterium]
MTCVLALAACRARSDAPTRVHKAGDDRGTAARALTPELAEPAADGYTAAYTRAMPWIESIAQKDDAARRDAALAAVESALAASDPREVQAGLVALTQTSGAGYDKMRFRASVRAQLDARDAAVRRSAYYALFEIGAEPADVERALRLAADGHPLVRDSAAHIITLYRGGDLTGDAARAIETLLDDPASQLATLRGIWGARVSPSLASRVLSLSRSDSVELAHAAIYFALSTFQDKSQAVVARLVEALADPDPKIVNRAQWGLSQGVPEALWPEVADALLAHFAQSTSRMSRIDALRAVGKIGDEKHAAVLADFVNRRGGSPEMLEIARQAVDDIRARTK